MNNLFYKQINLNFCAKVRRPLIILLLIGLSNVLLASPFFSQQVRNFSFKNYTLKQAIEYILKDGKYNFTYSLSDIERYKNLSLSMDNATQEEALKKILSENGLTYNLRGDNMVILKAPQTQPQTVKLTIAGKVIDDTKKPIAGATIIVLGTTNGAITDDKGIFNITLTKGQSIEVSYMGKESLVKVIETSDQNIVIQMKASSMAVDDVVVTGYFNKNKERYTGAVTSFSGKDLRSISTGNILNSLSMIDPSFVKLDNNIVGSNPNALPTFEIRGSGNLKSEYEGDASTPTFIMDGFEVSAQKVFDLDPNRIKSVTILKDAAATAIYGSRAANGVIVVETNQPKAGQLTVSYNGSANFEIPDLSGYNLMNAREKLQYELKAGLFPTNVNNPEVVDKNLEIYNQRRKLIEQGYDTNWLHLPLKHLGVGQRHNLGIEGGDDTFRYSVGAYYANTTGVIKKSERNSYGGSVSLQYTVAKFRLSNYTSFDQVKGINSPFDNYSNYTYANPYYYPYKEDGTIDKVLYEYIYYDNGERTETMNNWLYDTTLPFKDESCNDSFANNLSLEYDIIPGLKMKGNISVNFDHSSSDSYRSKDAIQFNESEKKGSYSQSYSKGFSYDVNAMLSYFKLVGKHAINIGAVYNIRESTSDGTSIYIEGFPNANMDHITMGSGFTEGDRPGGSYQITRMLGFMGDLGYSYDNKYLLDASVRSDASSIFGSKKRWSTFWSVGLGWNIHKENFLKDSKVLTLLKIRGSIGTTGGQKFNPYQSMEMFSYTNSGIRDIVYDKKIGALLMAFGNDNLKWQVTDKRNIGFDFEILNRRLTGSFNYYNDLSKDALIDVTLPPSTGFSSYAENLGKIKNTGFDLSLRWTVIRNYDSDFNWNVNLNVVKNKNQLLEINNALTAFNNRQDDQNGDRPLVRYQEGLSMNTIWLNESLGIDPATGNELFLDVENKITDKWDAKNYKPLGNRDPKVFGNIGTSIYYKGFEFSASFYYRYGGQNYNQTLVSKIENVNPNQNGDKRILYDRWSAPGDVAKYKKVSDVSMTQQTSRFLEDENYMKLQYLTIAYQFNAEKLRNIGIERIRVAAMGNDIFTISSIKMERGIEYPFARTFSLSVQLTF